MSFDYNQSIWGQDTASLSWSHPTAFRLKISLQALSGLPKGAKILEVGCGSGQFIRAIKQQLPYSECYGFDISQSAIGWAQSHDSSVKYMSGPSSIWPYTDNFFDAVLIYDVLEHVESVQESLSEIKRVLKNNGVFYAFVPCEGDKLSLWYQLRHFSNLNNLTAKYAGHINRYSKDQWKNIFKKYDFKIEQLSYSEHFLGQLLGVVSFLLMDKKAKQENLSQLNNEIYFKSIAKDTKFKKSFSWLRHAVNTLVYIESVTFSRVPSPNVHFFLKKSL